MLEPLIKGELGDGSCGWVASSGAGEGLVCWTAGWVSAVIRPCYILIVDVGCYPGWRHTMPILAVCLLALYNSVTIFL